MDMDRHIKNHISNTKWNFSDVKYKIIYYDISIQFPATDEMAVISLDVHDKQHIVHLL